MALVSLVAQPAERFRLLLRLQLQVEVQGYDELYGYNPQSPSLLLLSRLVLHMELLLVMAVLSVYH